MLSDMYGHRKHRIKLATVKVCAITTDLRTSMTTESY